MAGDITDFRNSHNLNSPTASTQGKGEDWRQYIPEPDTSNNDWGGYRPETYEYTDWSGKKQRAPYVPNAPRPDAFNNVPGVENDPSDALGLWNMSRYYDSGAIRAPQWYIHGGVDSYGDSSAYPYYERESYKNTYGAGRNPFAEAHPNWNWTEGDLSSTRPGWDSQGNVVGGWNADGSTRPYVPGPNDRYQGGGPPPPKVRGNGWGGQDWWNQGANSANGGAGAPASTQTYGSMGGASRSPMSGRSSGGSSYMLSSQGGGLSPSSAQLYGQARTAPPTSATQDTGSSYRSNAALRNNQMVQAPMSDDELRASAWADRQKIAAEMRNSQAYKDRIAAGAKARPYMRALTTDSEWQAAQNDPTFRFDYDFLVPSGGKYGDVQSANVTRYMKQERDRYGNVRLSLNDPRKFGKSTANDLLADGSSGGYAMDPQRVQQIMSKYNKDFDKTGGGAMQGTNVIDEFAKELNRDDASKASILKTQKYLADRGQTNRFSEAYKLYQSNPELFKTSRWVQGMGDVSSGGDQYDRYFDSSGKLRGQSSGYSMTTPQGTDWNISGPNGAALFGTQQQYGYFPANSPSMSSFENSYANSLPDQFNGLDPQLAMMIFGGR